MGAVHEAEAAAAAAELEAKNLEELSADGGYYDQVIEALKLELDDIEADRDAAAQNLTMTLGELETGVGVSKLQEAASVAGQAAQGLGAARQGAEIGGALAARAGAGGVSVGSGSVLRTAAAVNRAVSRQVAVTNINIGATRAAGAYQREVLQNNMTRARLDFQNTQRGLDTREAQLTAQETLTEYNQETGQERADLLQTEADWIRESGIPLTKVGGALNVAGSVLDTIARLGSMATVPTDPMSEWLRGGTEPDWTRGTTY